MTALWSFDLDGVLAEAPFGWNPAINRDVGLQPEQRTAALTRSDPSAIDRLLIETWYRLRYVLRPPRPGALEAVQAAAERGTVIVLTGRDERGRRQTSRWLDTHGFSPYMEGLIMNGSPLRSARYKEAHLTQRRPRLHVDDDAATCALLARHGIAVAMAAWPRNRGLEYPTGVTRCAQMSDVTALIERFSDDDATSSD